MPQVVLSPPPRYSPLPPSSPSGMNPPAGTTPANPQPALHPPDVEPAGSPRAATPRGHRKRSEPSPSACLAADSCMGGRMGAWHQTNMGGAPGLHAPRRAAPGRLRLLRRGRWRAACRRCRTARRAPAPAPIAPAEERVKENGGEGGRGGLMPLSFLVATLYIIHWCSYSQPYGHGCRRFIGIGTAVAQARQRIPNKPALSLGSRHSRIPPLLFADALTR